MKQFLILGLLVVIQVNFICGYWIQTDSDDDLLGDDYYEDEDEVEENNDYTQNFQDSLQSWQPAVQYYPDNEGNDIIEDDSNYDSSDDFGDDFTGDYQYEDVNDESFQQLANIRRRRSANPIPYNFPEAALQRVKRNDWYISECTRDECRHRGNGWRALEECGPAFCTCQNGNAYLQGCGQGLVYHAEKRLCTWYYNVPGC